MKTDFRTLSPTEEITQDIEMSSNVGFMKRNPCLQQNGVCDALYILCSLPIRYRDSLPLLLNQIASYHALHLSNPYSCNLSNHVISLLAVSSMLSYGSLFCILLFSPTHNLSVIHSSTSSSGSLFPHPLLFTLYFKGITWEPCCHYLFF